MYESKEFLKKQTNERTKGSLEIVAETEREQKTHQVVAQCMLVCCNVCNLRLYQIALRRHENHTGRGFCSTWITET